MRAQVVDGARAVRGRGVQICLLAAAFFLGLGSEGWDRLQQAHFLDDLNFPPFGTAVVWFGAMGVASLVGSIALTQVIRRHVDALRPVRLGRILVMAQVVVVGGIVLRAGGGVLDRGARAVAPSAVIGPIRSVAEPVSDPR
ncbi:hypothetical protein ABN028_03185 [Actinopolymorpha sp. B17G11]|uniref:hypothetical protein n=1 Tax=Actinopolymorpha sp. B17G11 TaxID=3160861 RepID=UPI0032E4A22C